MHAMKDSLMDTREDVRTVEKSFKIVHQLCRQYGMSFDREFERSRRENPDAQRVRRKRVQKPKRKKSVDDDDATSSADSYLSSEPDPNGLDTLTGLAEIHGIVDKIEVNDRVGALEEIEASLSKSVASAQENLRELDRMESNPAGPEGGVLNVRSFDPTNTDAVSAVRRCQGLMPELRQWTHRKLVELQEREERERLEEKEEQEEESGSGASSDDGGENELAREVEHKLKAIDGLPPGADPDLGVVLLAQRYEVRQLVQEIKEKEHHMKIRKLGMSFVNKRMSAADEQSKDAMKAIADVKEMLAVLVEKMKEKASFKEAREAERSKMPTLEDLDAAVLEESQLTTEIQRARARYEKMEAEDTRRLLKLHQQKAAMAKEGLQESAPDDEPSAAREEAGEGEDADGEPERSPGRGPRRASVVHEYRGKGILHIPKLKVSQEVVNATKAVAAEEEQVEEEEKRLAQLENVMVNIQDTLSTLEESRMAFLRTIAQEAPHLLDDWARAKMNAPMKGSAGFDVHKDKGGAGDADSDENGGDDEPSGLSESEARGGSKAAAAAAGAPAKPMSDEKLQKCLKDEEAWLRAELSDCLAGTSSVPGTPASTPAGTASTSFSLVGRGAANGDPPFTSGAANSLSEEIEKLAQRVEDVSRRTRSGDLVPDRDETKIQEARVKMALAENKPLLEVLKARAETSRLNAEARRAAADLDRARSVLNPPWPAALLQHKPKRIGSAVPKAQDSEIAKWKPDIEYLQSKFSGASRTVVIQALEGAEPRGNRDDAEEIVRRRVIEDSIPSEVVPVLRKARELHGLRMLWWNKRQGPHVVVRPALALEGLALGSADVKATFAADKPSSISTKVGFCAQLQSSIQML